jgi:hypothetical protein
VITTADDAERQRADWRLAMAMEDAARAEAGIEDVLGCRLGAHVQSVPCRAPHRSLEADRYQGGKGLSAAVTHTSACRDRDRVFGRVFAAALMVPHLVANAVPHPA